MLYTGLVSVTFRELSPCEIVELVSKAGLQGIEWGGDIHVPNGNLKRAVEVLKHTEDAGLRTASYGSYYRLGTENSNQLESFNSVIETALAIKAPTIRVWAGGKSSHDMEPHLIERIISETFHICEMAKKAGITVSLEFHGGTFTDTGDSTVRLIEAVKHPNLCTYWQALNDISPEDRMESLESVLPWISNVHVFQWNKEHRMSLKEGKSVWKNYLQLIKEQSGEHFALLEFIKEDKPKQFLEDAKILRELCFL